MFWILFYRFFCDFLTFFFFLFFIFLGWGSGHLFCLKQDGQNRRFNLWKCAVSGCVWKGPEWILSVFKQFDEGLNDFLPLFDPFDPFWAIFDHFWLFWGLFRPKKRNNRFLAKNQKNRFWPQNRKKSRFFLAKNQKKSHLLHRRHQDLITIY